jgi:hypothetical protein
MCPKGNLSTKGKSKVNIIGMGICNQQFCTSKLAAPKEVKYLGDEFYGHACGNQYNPNNITKDSRVLRPWGTAGTSSVATIGVGRVDAEINTSPDKSYLFNLYR